MISEVWEALCKVHGFGCPTSKDFFTSLGRLLESAEGQENTVSYDSAEFFWSPSTRKLKNSCHFDSKNRRSLPKWSRGDLWSKRTCFSMNELSRDFDSNSWKLCTMTPVFVGLISEEFLESPKELCAVEDIEFGLPVGVGENFSDVSNDDLDEEGNSWSDTKRWSTPCWRGPEAKGLTNPAPSYSGIYSKSRFGSSHFKSSTADNS